MIIPNAVPQELLDGVIDAIWEYLGVTGEDPKDWYKAEPRNRREPGGETISISRGGGVRVPSHPAATSEDSSHFC